MKTQQSQLNVILIFAAAVIAELTTQNWTTRPPETHLILAFEKRRPHASENNFGREHREVLTSRFLSL